MKILRLLSFLLMTVVFVESAWSDISIVRFSGVRHGNVVQQRVLDDKGRFCALIRIKTDIKDIMVDATQARNNKSANPDRTLYLVESQCESHPGEMWLYVSSATKRLRLFHSAYGGMKEGSGGVRFGYYYLSDNLSPELIYQMEIKCDAPTAASLANSAATVNHTLVNAQFNSDDNAARLYLDGNRLRSSGDYLLPTGKHTFTARRIFYATEKQRFEAVSSQPLDLKASLTRIPINVFVGLEMGKPTSYSDLAYGVRAGIICRWGLYFSYLTTFGNAANGEAVNLARLPFESIPPYSDPHCQFWNWNVGLIYNCFSALHIYAGVGQAMRSVNWLGLDGMRHEMIADHFSGTSLEAGLLYNANKFYLSAGADCVDGEFGGRVGVGFFFNILK